MNDLRALSTITRPPGSSDRKAEPPRTESATVTPFDALLDATRQSVRARTLSEMRESPEQMFEPKNVDERERRKEALQDADAPKEQPAATKPSMEFSGAGDASTNGNTNSAPASRHRESSTRTMQSAVAEVAPIRDTQATPSPTNKPATRPITVERSTEHASTKTATERGEPSEPTNMNSHATPTGGAAAVAASTFNRTTDGDRTVARSLGEALGAKAIDEVGATRGISTTASPTPRPTNEKNASAQAPQAKASGETPASPQPTTTETDTMLSPFERLVHSIRLNVGERFSTARMELDPPELGRMHVEVRLRGDAVELEVRTSNEAARDIVSGRAEELKAALEQHGVQVQRFDVVVDGPTIASRRQGGETEKPTRRRDDRSTGERADLRRVLSRLGRLDVKA